MIKDFIPYEQALELKELGFKEPCFEYWKMKNWIIQEKTRTDGYTHADQVCGSVLYQQAFRWFREKYHLFHTILEYNKDGSLIIEITKDKIEVFRKMTNFDISEYQTVEIECLKKLIEICKDENIRKSP